MRVVIVLSLMTAILFSGCASPKQASDSRDWGVTTLCTIQIVDGHGGSPEVMGLRLSPHEPYPFQNSLGHGLTLEQIANGADDPGSILEISVPANTDYSARDLLLPVSELGRLVIAKYKHPLKILLYIEPRVPETSR